MLAPPIGAGQQVLSRFFGRAPNRTRWNPKSRSALIALVRSVCAPIPIPAPNQTEKGLALDDTAFRGCRPRGQNVHIPTGEPPGIPTCRRTPGFGSSPVLRRAGPTPCRPLSPTRRSRCPREKARICAATPGSGWLRSSMMAWDVAGPPPTSFLVAPLPTPLARGADGQRLKRCRRKGDTHAGTSLPQRNRATPVPREGLTDPGRPAIPLDLPRRTGQDRSDPGKGARMAWRQSRTATGTPPRMRGQMPHVACPPGARTAISFEPHCCL